MSEKIDSLNEKLNSATDEIMQKKLDCLSKISGFEEASLGEDTKKGRM